MESLDEQLISRTDRLALLFTPPFDKTSLEPGYIKGYPPGIRENGGQYTHAAAWSVMALCGAWATATRQASCSRCSTRSAMLRTRAGAHRYKVEPYVIAADVYSVAPHIGRGGWTWYTGSAGWMYRAGIESILGLRVQADDLLVDPCIPKQWPGFEMMLRYRGASYEISVVNPAHVSRGVARIEFDDKVLPEGTTRIALANDQSTHKIRVILG